MPLKCNIDIVLWNSNREHRDWFNIDFSLHLIRLCDRMNAGTGACAVGAVAAVTVPTYFLINKWAQGAVYNDNSSKINGKVVIITGGNKIL